MVILCRRVHQERLEGSEMAPRYWSWVLDHLVAANRMSSFSQEKGIEDLGGMKCINSVPLPRGLHIQDRFAAVEDLELFWRHEFSTCSTKYQSRLMKRWRTDRLVLGCGGPQTCCSILNWWDRQADRLYSPPSGEYGSGEGLVLSQIAELLWLALYILKGFRFSEWKVKGIV